MRASLKKRIATEWKVRDDVRGGDIQETHREGTRYRIRDEIKDGQGTNHWGG